jgi:GT2 family glycosyltransferase
MNTLGIVVIGRNEGERLKACFESILGLRRPIVYVDSGSTDGSPEYSTGTGATTVSLDMSIPFTAARARNVGYDSLVKAHPDVQYVQFVDGDCIVQSGWLHTAIRFLETHLEYAIVCGRVSERFPDASIYNRLMDMEWNTPCGDANACGGIFAIRATTFRNIGGFDANIIAGEEPELCFRLRKEGWKIRRLPDPMVLHDAAMSRFSQWWKRSIRCGYGSVAVYLRSSEDSRRPYTHLVRSSRLWVLGFPAFVLFTTCVGVCFAGWIGFIAGLLTSLGLMPLQILRIAWKKWNARVPFKDSITYGFLIMIAKPAEFLGQVRYYAERIQGKLQTIIEHKD